MSKTKRRFGAMLLAFCMLVGAAAAVPVSASTGSSGSTATTIPTVTAMFTNVSHMGSFTVTPALGSDCDVLVSGYDANNRLTNVAVLQGVDLSAGNTVVNNAGEGFDFSTEADSYKIIVLEDLDTLAPATTAATGTVSKTVKETPTIYLAGDSTVCDYPDNKFPKAGWGMVLDNYITQGAATIVNKAVSGTSTRSFKYDTSEDANGTEITQRYIDIRDGIEAGDLFFIQFGHNDMWQDDDHAAVRVTVDEYKDYLVEYVKLATDKGAYPMLVSSMVRNPRTRVAEQVEQLKTFADAMKEVAETYGVPFVNLHDYSTKYMQDIVAARGAAWQDDLYVRLEAKDARYDQHDDPAVVAKYQASDYYSGVQSDDVHFTEYGANIWAKRIAQGIKDNGLYIADDITLEYSAVNPGDKFLAMNLYKSPYNGAEDFEGTSPKFSKSVTENNAVVEVAANPASESTVNTSAYVLKITPDNLLSGGSHTAYVKPTINTETEAPALPERYFNPLDKYTLEFDLYLASEPDSTRTWIKSGTELTFEAALEEHHINVNHYAISPQNSAGSDGIAIGGLLGTSTKDANDKTAWNDDKTFRFGSRYDGTTGNADWKATNLDKGAWYKIKLEYYPDLKDYSKTVTHFYVNGSYTGSTDVYFGNDPANPVAPMTDIIQLSFAGQMRNMLELYVDNVSIKAEKKTESTDAAVLQSLTVTGLAADAVTVDNETRTVTVNVPVYDENGNAPGVDLAAAEVTAAVETGEATVYIGGTSFAADGSTKATVDLEGSNILTLVNDSGITTYELEIQRKLTETFDNADIISGTATGINDTGGWDINIVKSEAAQKYIVPGQANWASNDKSAADQLSIGVAPITEAKQANGNTMGAGQASGNALFVKKNNGSGTQSGSANVVIKNLPNLAAATAFELEYDVAFDYYADATNATVWGTTGAGVEINGERFRLYTSKGAFTAADQITDEGNYLRMNFGQAADSTIKGGYYTTANGDSGRPKAQTDSWHRIKIVASKAQDGTMPATFYCDGKPWMSLDLATKVNDNCKEPIGWPTQITIRTSDRRSARIWVDNLTVTYK